MIAKPLIIFSNHKWLLVGHVNFSDWQLCLFVVFFISFYLFILISGDSNAYIKHNLYVTVLPPVLVPRYSEYPTGMASFQPVPEPSMPYNVSFPHSFQMSPGGSSGPGSPYCLSGRRIIIHLCYTDRY